jgi:hypothetical protein
MADLKIRTVPWKTKISHVDQFTAADQWQWHQGTNPLYNKFHSYGDKSSSNFTTDGIEWHRQGEDLSGQEGDCQSLFEQDGFHSQMYNGNNYNQVFFFGSRVDDSGFTNNTFTYPSTTNSSFLRNVVGFACENNSRGSYSDGSGGAKAYLEKVAFFYMHPETRKRSSVLVNTKLAGNINMNQLYPNDGYYWYSYTVSSTSTKLIKDNELLFTGMGFQLYHSHKTAKHTSRCNIYNFRILCNDSTSWVTYPSTNLLYLIPNVHSYSSTTDLSYDL